MGSGRGKWRHLGPPPPTPRILHFPRRNRLGALIDRERRARVPIVVLDNQDKWKFQADMLRAECNLLRMEKEIAFKKLERTRLKIHSTLSSALHTLLSARIMLSQGNNVDMLFDQHIHHFTRNLQRFHQSSKLHKDFRTKNFDKQLSVLQSRLEKIGGSSDQIVADFQDIQNIRFSIKSSSTIDDHILPPGKLNVDIMKRKMEGLSKGILLQRMEEEYNSLLSTASSSLASSCSNSKRVEFQDPSSIRVPPQEKLCGEGNLCSGHCKTVVRKIVEQVRTETEQWSQMQEMLGKVREEMEELQASRDFWEDRARQSDFQIQSLHNEVQEWKQKALSYESKTNEVEAELGILRGDVERLRKEQNAVKESKSSISVEKQNELEKRIVVCCSKENNNNNGERKPHSGRVKQSPLGDIGNSSSSLTMMRLNGKAVFPLR
ncbi:hypothetical protein VNO78_05099 [Psophocarpus tetragonolobus]|uniref:Uncharacterized protein n=1 Tax=Psophocarpus tetragonolobus TaxID=3891 RepID=A0AAN9SRG1_PSOTE